MRYIAVLCLTLAAACRSAPPACALGETRCDDDVLLACGADERFVAITDCGARGQRCSTRDGEAACVGAICKVIDFEVDQVGAGADSLVSPMQWLYADDLAWMRELYLENYPVGYAPGMTPGASGAVVIDEEQADYGSCGVCLFGFPFRRDGTTIKTLFAERGSVEFIALAADPGGSLHVVLHDVVLREVEVDDNTLVTTDVVDGERWCIDGLVIVATATRLPCEGLPDSFCSDDLHVAAQCSPDALEYVGVACEPGLQCFEGGRYGVECTQTCTAAQAEARRCDASRLQRCQGGAWITDRDCLDAERICAGDTVGAAGCYQPCSSKATERCAGELVEACDGTAWLPEEDCVALGRECKATGADASCALAACATEGEGRCIGGTTLQRCQSGAWSETACSAAGEICDDSLEPTCAPEGCSAAGAVRCFGELRQRCERGVWGGTLSCLDAGEVCDSSGGVVDCYEPCTAGALGELRCATGTRLERCNGHAFVLAEDCAPSSCVGAGPGVASCVDG